MKLWVYKGHIQDCEYAGGAVIVADSKEQAASILWDQIATDRDKQYAKYRIYGSVAAVTADRSWRQREASFDTLRDVFIAAVMSHDWAETDLNALKPGAVYVDFGGN